MKNLKRTAILFLCITILTLFYSSPCFSEIQGLTGNMDDGQEITLSGSGFGTKSPAAPILWESFENGVSGQSITNSSNWTIYPSESTNGGLYNTTASNNGNQSAYSRVTGPNVTGSMGAFNTSNYFLSTPQSQLYYTYQWRFTSSGDDYAVVKMGRMNTGANRYNGDGNLAISSFNPLASAGTYAFYEVGGSYADQEYVINPTDSVWARHELFKKNSTPGVANGAVWVAVDGNAEIDSPNAMTRAADNSELHTSIILGLMAANMRSNGDIRMWVDDVYVDNTLARVELCPGSTWASRGVCSIQIPSAWSSTSVTATVNTGNFNTGQAAYLYVVDRYGVVSGDGDGFRVEIGSANSPVYGDDEPPEEPDDEEIPTKPEPPTELRIQSQN
jgi:hypothetical protein